ncbi:tripartite motif-containing protein 2-like isoform X1 [Watersipora subatra]|uniref:tripartite motif-containing protein 2-like isoform X1 n=1 Tax=Watersipora subatra TaxID=2589382 RepID=UPI00355B3361
MEEASAEMKCGFCMRKNNTMEDPKVLPCNHVHCFGCLSSFEVNHKLQCPVQGCGKVSSIPLRNLKSFDLMVERDDFCDTCENKEAATIFCLGCSRKFCEKHQQSHDDVLKDHTKIAMSEYREQAAKLEKRTCSIHEYQPYILGCKVCLTIACVQCISGLEECENGGHHMLMSLKELTKMLVEDDRVVVKEEKLEKIFKETSKAQSEYDSETNEMVQLLHKTRDDQLSCIRLKYDLLEAKLLEERAKGKLQLAEFLEDIAISKWTRLRNQRLMIESKERNSHEVDFVKGYKELSESLQKVLEDELPKLEIQDIAQLDDCGKNRMIELQMTAPHRLTIDYDTGAVTVSNVRLPKSMTTLKYVSVSGQPVSICCYKNNFYVGLGNGSVVKMSSYQPQTIFTLSGVVQSITVYNERIYTLSCGSTVSVHGMSGSYITKWTHRCYDTYSNALTIISDEIVLPDTTNKNLVVYSLTGSIMRRVACPWLVASRIAMCPFDNTSAIVACSGTKTFCVNFMTGERLWTHEGVSSPPGLTCYGRKYVLVSQSNTNKISILDISSGQKVAELTDRSVATMHPFGMHVTEDRLVVGNYNGSTMRFYQLNYD